ncbi:MAG: DUF4328 domain-containing protein [Bacteroidetes bacterium]|nr:DUF4328 domain-containing protein [Bacteroidota bacterium]
MQKKPVSPAKAITVALMLCLGAGLFFSLFIAVSSYFIGQYVQESEQQLPNFLRTITASVVAFLFFSVLLSAIFVGIWMFRITKNVTTAFKDERRINPSLAAASWYIPLFNLFFPFRQFRICRQLLISKLPYGMNYNARAYPIMLWQIGFSFFVTLQLFGFIMIRVYENYRVEMSVIVYMTQVLAAILGFTGGIITLFQYFRLEKLVYPHLTSTPKTETPA